MNLPDALLERARERAAAERRTVTSLVEEALRALLESTAPVRPTRLPTDGHAGGVFLVDIDDKDALQAIFDDEDRKDLPEASSRR